MIWIGLHGVMFLFLFSDFYKAKYLNAQRRRREAIKVNGYSNGVHANGDVKKLGSGDTQLDNGSNKGACMVRIKSFFLRERQGETNRKSLKKSASGYKSSSPWKLLAVAK